MHDLQRTPPRAVHPAPSRWSPLLVLALLLLGGCRDGTGPGGGMELQLLARPQGSSVQMMVDGPRIRCDVEVSAAATGRSGTQAQWRDAVLRFAYGADRRTFTDSVHIPATEVRAAWGSSQIEVGETQQSTWEAWAGIPFTARVEFRYAAGGTGQTRSAAVQFDCGPPAPPAGTPAPTVGGVTLSPSGGTAEVGHPSELTVSYTAASPAGLWVTGVEVTGAFEHVVRAEASLRPQETRTVQIPIPSTARLGERVWVRVFAVDVGGQESVSVPMAGPTMADNTPPTLHSVSLGMSGGLAGQFAESDTLRISIGAWDNHRLSHVVYHIGPPVNLRDSLDVSTVTPTYGPAPTYRIEVPLRAEWIGSPSLTVYARDVSGHRSAERTSHPDSLHIYPVRQRPHRATTVPGEVSDAVYDPARDQLYLAASGPNRVDRVSLATMQRATLATPPGGAVSLDVAPDGRTLILALATEPWSLALVDLEDAAAAPRVIPFAAAADGFVPRVVRFASTGRALVVARGRGRIRIVELDPATGAQVVRWDEQMNLSDTAAGARALDGSRVAFYLIDGCGVVLYEAAADRFGPCRVIETRGSFTASADGMRFARERTVYGSGMEPIRTFPEMPLGSGISYDGREFFLGTWKGLIRAPVATFRYTERIPLPTLPSLDGRLLHARGGRAMVSLGRRFDGAAPTTDVVVVELD